MAYVPSQVGAGVQIHVSPHTCSTRRSKPLYKDERILHRKLKPIGTVFVPYQTEITLVRERQT